jgi:predicted dehydrogenase
LEIPLGGAVARSARALRQLEEHSHAVLAVGEERRWENLFKTLADDPDNEYAMIDATIVRAHQHSAGALKKGGSTKP